uniref:Uncharacterized protein n=1 Tax=Plectus sambesii TaxID=2011161 RepID=A0A914VW53_9BILA
MSLSILLGINATSSTINFLDALWDTARRQCPDRLDLLNFRHTTSFFDFIHSFIKPKVCTTKPRDIVELKDRIWNAFGQVSDEMRQKMLLEYRDRLKRVLKNEGGHIEQYNL